MSTVVRNEYRVETRQKAEHPNGQGKWIPEGGDSRVFRTREGAEAFMDLQREWYGSPRYFEHRISARAVTDWMPVAPTVEFPR